MLTVAVSKGASFVSAGPRNGLAKVKLFQTQEHGAVGPDV